MFQTELLQVNAGDYSIHFCEFVSLLCPEELQLSDRVHSVSKFLKLFIKLLFIEFVQVKNFLGQGSVSPEKHQNGLTVVFDNVFCFTTFFSLFWMFLMLL